MMQVRQGPPDLLALIHPPTTPPRRNYIGIIHVGIRVVHIGTSNYTVPRSTLLRYILEGGFFRHEISTTLTT